MATRCSISTRYQTVATWSVTTESGDVKSGAWGAPPTQLWEIDALGKRLVQQHPQSVVVDLDAREDGVVFVGWRGRTKGLWRVDLRVKQN